MTNFSRALIQSRPRTIFQRVVPANAGTHTARTLVSAPEPRPLSLLRPGVMGPCVRRDDSSKRYVYENSICDNSALTGDITRSPKKRPLREPFFVLASSYG